MNYGLNLDVNNIGGYLSSEQIDLLSIIQAKDKDELLKLIKNIVNLKDSKIDIDALSLEEAKKLVFKTYQSTFLSHYSNRSEALDNLFKHLNINKEDMEIIKRVALSGSDDINSYIRDFIKNKYPLNYEEIFTFVHRFTALERDQIKDEDLYQELTLLNESLKGFDTLLIGDLKPETVINMFLSGNSNMLDFSEALNGLEFARKNNKHVRLHSLLTKGSCETLFKGNTKEEVLSILKEYVKGSVDFINKYNATHSMQDGSKVINAVDLFNEIVSFDKNEKGEYEIIWEKFGITLDDICEVFSYAKDNKTDGVSYIYNEPFLEDDERRRKVIEVLTKINEASPHLIDTLGSQMHITIDSSSDIYDKYSEGIKAFMEGYAKNYGVSEEKIRSLLSSKKSVIQVLKSEIQGGKINPLDFQNMVCGGEELIFGTTKEEIDSCFKDLKNLQSSTGVGLQITEFDDSLSLNESIRMFKKREISPINAYEAKSKQIRDISQIIKSSKVKLNGVSYWSLTDKIDTNVERIRETLLKKGIIKDINEIPTAFGGLLPTDYNYLIKVLEDNMDMDSTIKL